MTVPNQMTGALRACLYKDWTPEDARIRRQLFGTFERLMATDPEISGLPPDAWPLHLAIAAVEFGSSSLCDLGGHGTRVAKPDGGR
jgi:hypothetical protein